MPFGLQPTDLIGILIVALLLFGPKRLPEIGRSFGSMLREFRTATKEETQSPTGDTAPPRAVEDAAATVPCRNCAKPIQPGMRFCPECGAAQQVDAASG